MTPWVICQAMIITFWAHRLFSEVRKYLYRVVSRLEYESANVHPRTLTTL